MSTTIIIKFCCLSFSAFASRTSRWVNSLANIYEPVDKQLLFPCATNGKSWKVEHKKKLKPRKVILTEQLTRSHYTFACFRTCLVAVAIMKFTVWKQNLLFVIVLERTFGIKKVISVLLNIKYRKFFTLTLALIYVITIFHSSGV